MKKKTIKKYQGTTTSQVSDSTKYKFSPSGKVIKDSKGNILNPNSPQGKEALDAVKATNEQRKAVGQQKNGGTMKMGGTKKKMMAAPKKKTAAKKK